MALPLKSGADLYNNQALRMRLHNLGADPTEVGAGLIYFNTSTGLNTSQKARLYTGSAWKTIAFSEDLDVASNADFLALKDRVDLLSGDVDTDAIISNMKEVSAFLEGFAEDASLMDYLNTELGKKLDLTGGVMKDGAEIIWGSGATKIWGNSNGLFLSTPLLQRRASSGDYHVVLDAGNYSDYALPKSGGILRDSWSGGTEIRRADSNNGNVMLSFSRQDGTIVGGLGFGGIDNPIFVTQAGGLHTLLHSGNVGDYNAGGAYKLVTSGGVTYASELQNALFFGGSSFSLTHLLGDTVTLRSGANSTIGLRLNSSGNVTIGASDLAGNGCKLFVDGVAKFKQTDGTIINLETSADSQGGAGISFFGADGFKRGTITASSLLLNAIGGGNVLIGTTTDNGSGAKLQVSGDLHVTGNIIADGEVSAGGAGTEGGGSSSGGGGAFHSESIAVGATQTTIAHGLGTDDIVVSIYEKDGVSGRWSLILTDVEVVDANNIIVSFGSATSVEHKVVIMGAVA